MFNQIKKVVYVFLMVIFLLPLIVFAEDGLILNVDKTDLTIGDEITVSVTAPEDLKTYALLATLKYDNNVFQKINENDFSVSETKIIAYNEDNNKFGIINTTGSVTDGDVLFTVRLKVKSNANVGDTNIALTNISSSDGNGKLSYPTTQIKVFVSRDAKEGEVVPTNKENVIEEDEEKTINVFSNKPIVIGTGIGSGLLLVCLIYIIIKKRDKKLIILTGVSLTVFVGLFSALLILNDGKKDVNSDGQKDYNDAKEILEYLIDMEGTKEDNQDSKQENNSSNSTTNNKDKSNSSSNSNNNKKASKKPDNKFDTNNDGKVDVDDVGGLVDNVNKETKVTLEEVKDEENYYIHKGSVTLKFKANITPSGVKVRRVKVDGHYYDVELNDGIYYVEVNTPKDYGDHKFTFEEIDLNNEKNLKSDFKIEKVILKDAPYFHNFNLDDKKDTISFELVDPDDAFENATAKIYDADGDEIKSEKVSKDKTTIEFDGHEDKTYTLEIVGGYDLDVEPDNEKNHFRNTVLFTHSFTIGGNYNFTLTDLAITDALQENETPVITFKSTNNREAVVANVTVKNNDEIKDFNVSKQDGNNYEVELVNADTSLGKHTITLNNVGLDSLKTFYNDKDYKTNELTYMVLKKAPKVEDLTLTNNSGNKTVHATFKLRDENSATKKLYVVMIDSTGKIVTQKELTGNEIKVDQNISVNLSYDKNYDGYYTVKVLADYELADKYTYTNKSLGENSILTTNENDLYISEMSVENNNIYPTKGQKDFAIIFTVHVGDKTKAVAKTKYDREYTSLPIITINGLNYPVSGLKGSTTTDYKVKVNLTVPAESGPLEITASRIQLTISGYYNMTKTDMFSVNPKKVTIDVLKDKPKIDNLVITDDYEADTATLDFDVVLDKNAKENDNDFKNGLVKLGDQSQGINVGHNQIVFSEVPKDKNLDLVFNGTYDLDTDTLKETKDENETSNGELLKTKYGLYNNETYDKVDIVDEKTVSEKNNKYFEKNEKIKLSFGINGIDEKLEAQPQYVVIDHVTYPLNKTDDGYEVIANGIHSAGEKELTITDIILSNGKKINIANGQVVKYEVLKDIITVNDFAYKVEDDQVKIALSTRDLDNSKVGNAKVVVTDEAGNEVYNADYSNEVTFAKNDKVRFIVKVLADYDRDINQHENTDNYVKDAVLLEEVISLDKNNIELKEIFDISLYKVEKNDDEEVITLKDEINVSELQEHLDDYFVDIKMENMPSIRARIENAIVDEDNKLVLTLKYEYVTKTGAKSTARIVFGSVEDGVAKNETHPADAFRALLKNLEENKNVTLTQDYDASSINVEGNTYISKDFSGTLNGNGYTIKNLKKPLFNKIVNGTVENLILKDVTFGSSGKGALANEASKAMIKGVLVNDVNKTETSDMSGGFIGYVTDSTIENSSATNVYLRFGYYDQGNGAFIGKTERTTIKNCYATGTLNGGWNYTSGFVGNAVSSTFENNFVKVNGVSLTGGTHASFATAYANTQSVYINNICIASNISDTMIGSAKTVTNNYFYVDSEKSNNEAEVNLITKEQINADLFKNSAQFNEEIWLLDDVSYDNAPMFQFEKVSVLSDTTSDEYDETKETLYENLSKLTPFYDSDKIISEAKTVTDDLLLKEEIVHIVPVDSNGNLVTYLTTDNPKKISKVKVIFKNGDKKEYNVTYDKTYDMVATYKINGLNIDYNYNHYVIDSNSQVVNNLTNYLKSLDYTNNLDILTANDDSRIYRDFYNDVTKKEIKEFVLKYLSNSDYTNTNNDNSINNYIEREVKKDKKIEKALYVYNYFRRFYDVDVGGMKLYDFVFFNMQGFDKSLTTARITELLFGDYSGSKFNTDRTNNTYNETIGSYTGLKNISSFLEYVVTHLTNENMDKWTAKQFKGILVEIPVKGHEEDVLYTLWDHFSTEDANYKGDSYRVHNYVLPILTLPETAAYIISGPAQFTIGAQRVYMSNPNDSTQLDNFKARMKVYTDRITSYYNTAYAIIGENKIFNDIHLYQIDKRTTKNESGSSIFNYPYSTEEPFHKNFDEVVGMWPAEYGVNAGNWGDRIEWNVAGFMDSDIKNDGNIDSGHPTWATWSHESAHYLDGRLFLKNYGRRFDAGGEDYADEFLMQKFGSGVVMNLSIKYNEGTEVATNLNPERINSKDEIKDFYSKMYESIYVVDYIEAQAFLKLTPEEKSYIGIQVSYPNEEKYTSDATKHRGRLVSGFNQRSADEWSKMDLKNINDLIKNQIMIYPGVYSYSSRGSNSYGGEGINVAHWYQPNNPNGRPDSYALKWFSYEMMGYAGYDDGFVEYASNIHPTKHIINNEVDNDSKGTTEVSNYKTDNMAISTISKGVYNNIDEYKVARFADTASKLERLKYIDVDDYAQTMYEALVKDAAYAKKRYAELLANKNKTAEQCAVDSDCAKYVVGSDAWQYNESTKVRKEIYFKLKNSTKDFTEDIYSESEHQDVKFDIKVHTEEEKEVTSQ